MEMSNYIQPSPELLSPEYWNGLDINNGNELQGRRKPTLLSAKEQLKASVYLAHRLEEVMAGDSAESEVEAGSFDPTIQEMADGSVLLLDTEGLTKYVDTHGFGLGFKEPEEIGESRITDDHLEMWRRNQPGASDKVFGQEQAVFPAEDIVYTRALKWGVILSREIGSDRQRLLGTWQFSSPRTHAGGVWVVPEASDHGAKTLPMHMHEAAEQPNPGGFNFNTRSIERVNSITLVQ